MASVREKVTKHVLFLAKHWGWSQEDTVSSFIREMAIQLVTNQGTSGNSNQAIRVSFLVPKISDEQKKEAEENGVALFGVEPKPSREPIDCLSLSQDGIKEVDVVVGYGIEIGNHALSIQNNKNCKRVHIIPICHEGYGMCEWIAEPVESAEKRNEVEASLCLEAKLVVAMGTHLTEKYQHHLEDDGSMTGFTPSIFGELADVKQAGKKTDTFNILMFYPSSPEIKLEEFIDKIGDMLPPGKFHLTLAGVPKQKQGEVKKMFASRANIQGKVTIRSPCQSLKELLRWFRGVDVLVEFFASSHMEDFGMHALLAISASLPVLVSKDLGIAVALKQLLYGDLCVVEPDVSEQWKTQIMRVSEKKVDMRLQEASKMRHNYSQAFPWKEQCQDLAKKIFELC